MSGARGDEEDGRDETIRDDSIRDETRRRRAGWRFRFDAFVFFEVSLSLRIRDRIIYLCYVSLSDAARRSSFRR